jgi:hypothetical protein
MSSISATTVSSAVFEGTINPSEIERLDRKTQSRTLTYSDCEMIYYQEGLDQFIQRFLEKD